ncbi:MAG: hypothetical protein HUU13_16345 [Burkholderiaceae bacterium]|nr:hypothetical protein [Burkholderiaceae bacterium]
MKLESVRLFGIEIFVIQLLDKHATCAGEQGTHRSGIGHRVFARRSGDEHQAGVTSVVVRTHVIAALAAEVVENFPERTIGVVERHDGILERAVLIADQQPVAALPGQGLDHGGRGRLIALIRDDGRRPEFLDADLPQQSQRAQTHLGIIASGRLLQMLASCGAHAL